MEKVEIEIGIATEFGNEHDLTANKLEAGHFVLARTARASRCRPWTTTTII